MLTPQKIIFFIPWSSIKKEVPGFKWLMGFEIRNIQVWLLAPSFNCGALDDPPTFRETDSDASLTVWLAIWWNLLHSRGQDPFIRKHCFKLKWTVWCIIAFSKVTKVQFCGFYLLVFLRTLQRSVLMRPVMGYGRGGGSVVIKHLIFQCWKWRGAMV